MTLLERINRFTIPHWGWELYTRRSRLLWFTFDDLSARVVPKDKLLCTQSTRDRYAALLERNNRNTQWMRHAALRSDPLVKGAGRILMAPAPQQAFPTSLEAVVSIPYTGLLGINFMHWEGVRWNWPERYPDPGPPLKPVGGWTDLGATKWNMSLTTKMSEEDYETWTGQTGKRSSGADSTLHTRAGGQTSTTLR